MITGDLIEALKILSLAEVDSQSYIAWYKSTCRWYSREFHTPLSEVLEMSEEEVIQTYFDDKFYELRNSNTEQAQEAFENLKEDALRKGNKIGAKTEEQLNEEDDDSWYEEELAQLKKLDEDRKNKKKPNKSNKLDLKSANPNLNDTQEKSEMVFVKCEDN